MEGKKADKSKDTIGTDIYIYMKEKKRIAEMGKRERGNGIKADREREKEKEREKRGKREISR